MLLLGTIDERVALTEAARSEFLDLYHHPAGFVDGQLRFRDDSRNRWRPWRPTPGAAVTRLTQRLQRLGFMPHASHDGIFGYVTQAAVRLLQEYVRTVAYPARHAAAAPPCWPDGVVGDHTSEYLEVLEADGVRCRWGPSAGEQTDDYRRWMNHLTAVTAYYQTRPTPLNQQLAGLARRGDTLLPDEWSFTADAPHLIGLRYHEPRPRQDAEKRPPDDFFVLLLNGRTFYFSGSTDANPSPRREAYLVEGQHRYRFNWHNISAGRRDRVYKAARPAGAGVLVIRDVHGHNALTPQNRADGLDPHPNPTINIHWSGLGSSNWSAGCQVIGGWRYLNDTGQPVDCSAYTARNGRERGSRRTPDGPRLTMGAYTVLSDLLLCYTPQQQAGEKPTFRYTLLDRSTLDEVPGMDATELSNRLNLLRS